MKRIDVRGVPALEMATDTKAQALKVLEEAAELVEAYKRYRPFVEFTDAAKDGPVTRTALVDEQLMYAYKEVTVREAADVITATVGLLVAMGCDEVDISDAMQECAERQERRGRG